MSDFVRVPETDWQNILDAVREKTGSAEKMVSGVVASEIESIVADSVENSSDAFITREYTEINNSTAPYIGPHAFAYHTSLKSVVFTEADSIKNNAFQNSSISTAVFPKVASIGISAFARCDSLACLDFGSLQSLGNYNFEFCSALTVLILRRSDDITRLASTNAFNSTPFTTAVGTVYCPEALIETYQNATNWSTLCASGTCLFVPIEGSEYE